ncbi:MAG TPA: hypothetical protein VFF52_15160 [Isosphaeraceae bacterium]|nr:hypothetical protein [Isosphaeraceae bacterium]
MSALRTALVLVIASNLVMIGIRVLLDPQLLGMPGGLQSALEPAALLILAAYVVRWATGGDRRVAQAIVRAGTAVGLVGGMVEVVHITLENYGRLGARAESVTTGGFLVGLLLLWGIAGYRATRETAAVGAGLLAGSWSALVGMLMATTYGFSQLFWDLPRLEQRNVGSPDFLRSGWTDLHSFTIADVFEAGFKVLLLGPIAGAVLGGLGALLARAILAIRRPWAGLSRRCPSCPCATGRPARAGREPFPEITGSVPSRDSPRDDRASP